MSDINYTITQSGEEVAYTVSTGVGPTGPTGATGPAGADGPNNITTATTTDISGIIKGDGANVSAAVSGTDYAAASHTHVSADVTDATSDGDANDGKLLKTDRGTLTVGELINKSNLMSHGDGSDYVTMAVANVVGVRNHERPNGSGTYALTSQTDGSIHAEDLDFAGSTDIGADLADADEILVADGGGNTTRRKSALSRLWTYIQSKIGTIASSNGTPFTLAKYNISGNLSVGSEIGIGGVGTLGSAVFYDGSGSNGLLRAPSLGSSPTWDLPDIGGNIVMDAGNQTIGGNKTLSGQTELTGQAASSGTSAMTRDLGDARYVRKWGKITDEHKTITASTTLTTLLSITLPDTGFYKLDALIESNSTNSQVKIVNTSGIASYGIGTAGFRSGTTSGGNFDAIDNMSGAVSGDELYHFRGGFKVVTAPCTVEVQCAQTSATGDTLFYRGSHLTIEQLENVTP